jgi:ABC-type Zn uptake system ZnuABC Zn-binding protein ZnuA
VRNSDGVTLIVCRSVVAQGEHGNECAHAHDDPERGEESAERIRAERVEADPKGCRDDGTEHVMRGQ